MFFLTEAKEKKRPVSTFHKISRSTHRQKSVKFTKQPHLLQKPLSKQKSVGLQFRQVMASRELERSIQNLQGKKTAKQTWHKIVDLFHVFIETGATNAKQAESVTVSGTVTPGTIDQYTSIFSRAGEKNKTTHLRKNSNSFCLADNENQNNKPKKKSYFNIEEEKIEDTHRDKCKENRFCRDKSDFFLREKRSLELEVEKSKEKQLRSKRISQNFMEQSKELIIEQSFNQYDQNMKTTLIIDNGESTKGLSRYQQNKLEEKMRRQKVRMEKQAERLNKLIEEQKLLSKVNLFQCLLTADLSKKYRFNIPETIMLDEDRVLQLLSTQGGIIRKREVKKIDAYKIMEKGHEMTLSLLKGGNNESVYSKMYDNLIDPKLNEKAPFVVIGNEKNEKKKLRIEVENVKYFCENSWNANEACFLQRYIYSRNLKALIMRVVYQKLQRGQQIQEYYINRFQNYASIFGENNGFHDLRAKVSPSYDSSYGREFTLEYSKLTGKGVVNRFIQPTAQLKRLLECTYKKKVEKLWVDFIEDVAGTIWIVGVKAVVFERKQPTRVQQAWLISQQVGTCRLCNGVFQKRHLQNSVSVRMLLQFLNHLRRRTRIEDLHNFQFVNFSSLNKKEHAMSAVCECCYELIIRELELKRYQRQLGRICNIYMDDDAQPQKIEGKELRQWRLMVYLDQITQQSKESSNLKVQNLAIRYALSKGIEQKWKCKVEKQLISIKRVKVHYFFSQSSNIQDFLKNTEILVSVLSGDKQQNEKVIAQGSTGILANFRNKCATENGQRQTSTVLLFFQSRKYCALTLKVGLVYDGVYKVPEIPLIKVHSVMFPAKNWLNSNPLPKEWMQAFGYGQQINLADVRYEDLLKSRVEKKSTLTKKKMKNIF